MVSAFLVACLQSEEQADDALEENYPEVLSRAALECLFSWRALSAADQL